MEIQRLGAWYVAVVGNEKRGDRCGCCGEPILEGQKFYSWAIPGTEVRAGTQISIVNATGSKYPHQHHFASRVWVQLHLRCLLDVAEEKTGITDAQFEVFRQCLITNP